MSGCIRSWTVSLVSLAVITAWTGHAIAQAEDQGLKQSIQEAQQEPPPPGQLPEPGADELPSETPPPPPAVPPEPPPAAAPLLEEPPAALPPVMAATHGPAPKMDLTHHFSGTSLALGGAFLLSGGVTFAAAPGAEDYCTVSGCVSRRRDRALENIGADLMGAGGGFALVGGIGMLSWATSRPEGTERRHSVPMMTTGFSMTAFGAAGFGLGLAQTLTYARDEPDTSTSWPLFLTSGFLLAAGIPLWTAGANNRDAAERAQRAEHERLVGDPRVPKKRRSTGMVVGGTIMTVLGGLGGLGGTIVFIADTAAGGPSFLTAIIGLPSLGAGALFTGIGVPLIVTGNSWVIEGEKEADRLVPEVSVGVSGLGATWRLE